MRRGVTIAAVVVLAVVAIFVVRRVTSRPNFQSLFSLARAHYGTLVVSISGSGTVQATTTANVYASQSGTVVSIPVTVGSQVQAGGILAKVSDGGNLQNRLLSAESQLASDQASLDAAISPTPPTASQLSAQEAKVQADQTRLSQDQADRQALSLTAPTGGVIDTVDVSPGQSVGAGTPLFTLANPADMTATATVPQVDLSQLSPGQAATVATLTQGSFQATITSIGTSPSGNARGMPQYPITVKLQNATSNLASGEQVTIAFAGGTSYGTGSLAYADVQTLTAPVSATVTSLSATVGEVVSAGTSLGSLTSPTLQITLDQDQATLTTDQGTLDQMESPTPPSADTLASLKARVAADQASVQEAQAALTELSLTSPISGTVVAVNLQVGDPIGSGGANPAFVVENPNALEVVVPVNETQISQVHVGEAAALTTDALPGRLFPGVVSEVAPTGTNTQGVSSFNVTVALNQAGALKAGMAADVTINIATINHALLIPAEAVTGSGRQAIVRVMQKGFPVPQVVDIGLSNDVFAQVLSGLQPGEEVVTATTASATTTGPRGIFRGGGQGGQGGQGQGQGQSPSPGGGN